MKPGSRDIRHQLLVCGDELKALQLLTAEMAESFGLDSKIERYKGTRPLTLFRWDLECLLDVIEYELAHVGERPEEFAPDPLALKSLGQRLRQEYDRHYGAEDQSRLGGS